LIIGTKAKQFDLLRKLSQQKRFPASVSRGVGITEIYRTTNEEFFLFLYLSSQIFRRSDDFLANFREKS
jgi:hypothetical protein